VCTVFVVWFVVRLLVVLIESVQCDFVCISVSDMSFVVWCGVVCPVLIGDFVLLYFVV